MRAYVNENFIYYHIHFVVLSLKASYLCFKHDQKLEESIISIIYIHRYSDNETRVNRRWRELVAQCKYKQQWQVLVDILFASTDSTVTYAHCFSITAPDVSLLQNFIVKTYNRRCPGTYIREESIESSTLGADALSLIVVRLNALCSEFLFVHLALFKFL